MFLKQTSYKPRSNSQSSSGSGSGAQEAPKEPPKVETPNKSTDMPTGPVSAGIAGRRRSSASGAAQFSGLSQYKRGSQDQGKAAAFHEQKAGGGILGGMWNSFTKGS